MKHVARWVGPTALVMVMIAGSAAAQDAGKATPPAAEPALGSSMGREALQRAADEIAKASALTYLFEIKAEGILAAAYPSSRGQVWAMRDDKATNSGGWLVRIAGESDGKDGTKIPFDMAWRTGNDIEWVDHEAKKIMAGQGRQPQGAKGVMIAQRARLSELLATAPLATELAASSYEDLPTDTVSGEACTIVKFSGKRANTKLEWAIAQSDAMPRRVVQISEGSFSSTITLTTSDWVVETDKPQRISEGDLRVARPEGYTDAAAATGLPTAPQQVRPMTPPTAIPAPSDVKPTEATPEPKSEPKPEPPKAEIAPNPEPIGGPRPARAFELATIQGTKVSLQELRGKVVVVQFFGSWCLPCQAWHKSVVDAVEEGAGASVADVKTLAIAVRERDPQNAVQEVGKSGVGDAITVLVKGDTVAQEWGVKLYPTTYVIDREGRIRAEHRGDTSTGAFESLRDTLRTLVAEPASAATPPTPTNAG